jgi:hypothetical protein
MSQAFLNRQAGHANPTEGGKTSAACDRYINSSARSMRRWL